MKLTLPGLNTSFYSIPDFPMHNDDLCVLFKPKIILDMYKSFASAVLFCFLFHVTITVYHRLQKYNKLGLRDESPLCRKPLGYFHSGKNPRNYIEPALKFL